MRKSDGVRQSGTGALLFTDIEGRAQRWDAFGEVMAVAVARYDDIVGRAVQSHGGRMYKKLADAIFCTFKTVAGALAAAQEAQSALAAEDFSSVDGLRVRMAIDTGPLSQRRGIYVGDPVDRASGLLAVSHGGQILLSPDAARSVRASLPESCSLRDLGPHVLRQLLVAERVYQFLGPGLQADFPALRSLEAYPNNIPPQRTSFVDREDDIATTRAELSKTPLLTLVGTGGVGKTRLALQIAASEVESYADGVWFVELAALRNDDDVARRLAATFGVRELPGRPLAELICTELADRAALLVFDNCEHVTDAVASLAEALLPACPRLKLLCTSREPLGVAGERLHRLKPLAVPERADAMSADEAYEFAAMQLFVDRARAAGGAVTLPQNAGVVARIVRRLDGLPLAIELAASRTRTFVVEQVEKMLDDRLDALGATGGSRVERHRTMRALLDWSYELLSPEERRCFERLAVFAAGWTLEAAGAIALDEGVPERSIVDLLGSLIDKSLIVHQGSDTAARYAMLGSTHDYAVSKLAAGSDERRARERHAAFYAQLASTVEPAVDRMSQRDWFDRYAPELDNFRTAMDWAVGHDPKLAAHMAESLFYFWLVLSMHAEGLERTQAVLAALPQDDAHAHAALLPIAALLLQSFGDAEAALAAARRAQALLANDDDGMVAGKIEFALGYVLATTDDVEHSLPHLERAERLVAPSAYWQTYLAFVLGYIKGIAGDVAQARRALEPLALRFAAKGWPDRALAAQMFLAESEFASGAIDAAIDRAKRIVSEPPDRFRHWGVYVNLASYLVAAGEDAAAARQVMIGLENARANRHTTWFAYGIQVVALLAARARRPETAALLLGFTDAMLAEKGARRTPTESAVHGLLLESLRDMSEPALGDQLKKGAALDIDASAAIAAEIVAAVSGVDAAPVRLAILREEATVGDRTVALTAQETAALLLLARAHHMVSADELCAALWPEVAIDDARSALNSCFYRLRKKTIPQVVEALDDGYRLGHDVDVDVWEIEAVLNDARFQHPLDAGTLGRLGQCHTALQRRRTSQLVRYEWFVDVDAYLIELQNYAGERLLREQLESGDLHGAARRALEMLLLDPCDETAAEYAIRAHLQLGNVREASVVYDRYASALKRQLDATPSARISALFPTVH